MKLINLALTILLVTLTTTAKAEIQPYDYSKKYEPEVLVENEETTRLVRSLASDIEFKQTDLTSIQTMLAKRQFATCSLDQAVKIVVDIGGDDDLLNNVIDLVFDYHRYGEDARRYNMDRPDRIFVEDINIKCVTYHPNQKDVISLYVTTVKPYKEDCKNNIGCTIRNNLATVDKLIEDNNITQ